MTNLRTKTTFRHAALLLVGATMFWGCEDRNTESSAVQQAARRLHAVGSGALSDTGTSYQSVTSEIQGLSLDADATSTAASSLLSLSLQGSGSNELNAAMRADRALFDDISAVGRTNRRYAELVTTAEALGAFDPTEDLRRIEREAADLAERAEETRVRRAELASEIDGLNDELSALQSRSDAKRNEAAELKLANASASASLAARQALEIRELSREADAIDMQISRVAGRIETLSPQLAEFDAEIEKLIEQRRLALESAETLEKLRADWAVRAQEARANASDVAQRLDAMVDEIDRLRAETVVPRSDEAIDSLGRAVRSGEQASRSLRTSGRLAASAASRRMAEAHHIRAQGHARYAAMLENLAETTPTLPRADVYRGMAADERAAQAEHMQAAIGAYESAVSALRGTGARGDERDALEGAAAEIEALIATLAGGPTEAAPDGGEDPTGSP